MLRKFLFLCLAYGLSPASVASSLLHSTPPVATFGAYISSLDNFDPKTRVFEGNLWIWSQSPKAIGPILPRMNYINAKSINRDPQPTTFEADERRESVALQGTFATEWNMRNFPFDTHILRIPIEHLTLDSEALHLKSGSITAEPNILPEGWKLKEIRMFTQKHEYPTDFYSVNKSIPDTYDTVVIEMEIQRQGIWEFIRLVTGAELAALFAFLTFMPALAYHDKLEVRMGMLAGALFAVIANELAAGSIIDTTYVTLIDLIHLTTMLIICSATLMSFWPFGHMLTSEENQNDYALWRPRAGILLLFAYLSIQAALIARAALSSNI